MQIIHTKIFYNLFPICYSSANLQLLYFLFAVFRQIHFIFNFLFAALRQTCSQINFIFAAFRQTRQQFISYLLFVGKHESKIFLICYLINEI